MPSGAQPLPRSSLDLGVWRLLAVVAALADRGCGRRALDAVFARLFDGVTATGKGDVFRFACIRIEVLLRSLVFLVMGVLLFSTF